MKRVVHLNSMMAQFGLRSRGDQWFSHDMSFTQSLKHSYSDDDGNSYEVTEIFQRGNQYQVKEIEFRFNKANVAVKSYKQLFRHLKERMLEKIMNQ